MSSNVLRSERSLINSFSARSERSLITSFSACVCMHMCVCVRVRVNINRLSFINIYSVLCPCITDDAKCGYITQKCVLAITIISHAEYIPFFSVTSVLKRLQSPCCHIHRFISGSGQLSCLTLHLHLLFTHHSFGCFCSETVAWA